MVSIIVPVYNLEKEIAYCLEAITGQSYKDIDIIVVNDGSSDKSLEIVQSFSSQDKRIRVVTTNNRGVSNARNIGLEHAQGEYIAFIDGDDVVAPDYIEFLKEQLYDDAILSMCASETLKECHSLFGSIREKGREYKAVNCAEWLLSGRFYNRVWGALFRKDAIGDLRFLTKVKNSEDTLFLFSFLLNNEDKNVVFSNSKLYGYLNRSNSATKRRLNGSENTILVADIISEKVRQKHPEWNNMAQELCITKRLEVIKQTFLSEHITDQDKDTYQKHRSEIMNMVLPKEASKRLKFEYKVLKYSEPLYRLMVITYYRFVSNEMRHKKNERLRVKL